MSGRDTQQPACERPTYPAEIAPVCNSRAQRSSSPLQTSKHAEKPVFNKTENRYLIWFLVGNGEGLIHFFFFLFYFFITRNWKGVPQAKEGGGERKSFLLLAYSVQVTPLSVLKLNYFRWISCLRNQPSDIIHSFVSHRDAQPHALCLSLQQGSLHQAHASRIDTFSTPGAQKQRLSFSAVLLGTRKRYRTGCT